VAGFGVPRGLGENLQRRGKKIPGVEASRDTWTQTVRVEKRKKRGVRLATE